MIDPLVAADPRLLLERASTLYVIADDLSIRYANAGTARALGWESANDPAETNVAALLHPADRPLLAGVVRDLPPGGRSRQLQVRMRHTNGGWRTVAVVAHDMAHDERVGGLLLEGWDITEHLDELRATSLTDPLTGLANRALLGDRLRRSLALLHRSVAPVGLLFVDLNEFKAVNDTYGHGAGDLVLKEVAARMAGGLRPYDLLGRIGGEEFLIIAPDTDIDGALAIAERARGLVAGDPIGIGDRAVVVTGSFGVTLIDPVEPVALDRSLARVDSAMYTSKEMGRNRVTVFRRETE